MISNLMCGLILTCFSLILTENLKIVQVAIVFRNGNRAPMKRYSNDPWMLLDSSYGNLTEKGKRNSYDFGRWLVTFYCVSIH